MTAHRGPRKKIITHRHLLWSASFSLIAAVCLLITGDLFGAAGWAATFVCIALIDRLDRKVTYLTGRLQLARIGPVITMCRHRDALDNLSTHLRERRRQAPRGYARGGVVR